MNAFRESLLDLCQPNRASAHPPLERSTATQQNNTGSPLHDTTSNTNRSSAAAQAASTKQILDNFNKLMSACVILRIENFMLYRVTTSGKKQMPKEFISGKNRWRLHLMQIKVILEMTILIFCSNKILINFFLNRFTNTHTKMCNSTKNPKQKKLYKQKNTNSKSSTAQTEE